ncbi:MAG: S9 family peptidase [Colwellia sp.]|nr:S9 family peptidase [Colwellia sp.]
MNIDGWNGLTTFAPESIHKHINLFNYRFEYITNDGDEFYFLTSMDALTHRIIMINFSNYGLEQLPTSDHQIYDDEIVPEYGIIKEIVPKCENHLKWAWVARGNILVMLYVENCANIIRFANLHTGKPLTHLKLPLNVSIDSDIQCNRSDENCFMYLCSFTNPGATYTFNLSDIESIPAENGIPAEMLMETEITGLDLSDINVEQQFIPSKDGTMIPFTSLVSQSGSDKKPCVLYGYGSFSISLLPTFNLSRLLWVKHFGGIFVFANIRGGGEFGEKWHLAATYDKKQNSFDDFIAIGEHLTSTVTTSEQLGILGGSAGGLLVTAVANQRPDLFGAVIAAVPLTDMLRFHKFTVGFAWCCDYGSPDNPKEYDTLVKYSPVHNVPLNKRLPAIMSVTADHDDRVVPAHAYKYTAAIQYSSWQSSCIEPTVRPQICRIETNAGHGSGKSTEKRNQEFADIYGFLAKYTGAVWQS